MGKLLTLCLFSFLLFFGCNQDSEIISPEVTSAEKDKYLESVDWITLPSPSGGNGNFITFTNSELINGQLGGEVKLVTEYSGGPHGIVKIDSKLEIKQNSFPGIVEISTTCVPEEGLVEFGPPMVFDKDLEYTLVYEGIDLTGVNPETVKFCYIARDGSIVETENLGIDVDIEAGKIKVDKAFIPHFSRYGWVR
jgi:hypothetical protein